MFSGIIECLGKVRKITEVAQGKRLVVAADGLAPPIAIGDSIAINGVCLTIVALDEQQLHFDVSPETLSLTSLANAQIGSMVNVEAAMLPTSRFGGHIVSGHVDGLASVKHMQQHGDYQRVDFSLPKALTRYLVKKGSASVDGVSLTINHVDDQGFSVMIIPHTFQHTCFQYYQIGSQVNLEVDMIARYVERLLRGEYA